jgi:hypothetical protein
MNRPADNERGSVTAFVAIVATALVMVAGMAYDGGAVLTAHATARSHATKAARAGAQQLDIDQLRATGEVELDPASAGEAALAYLADVGANGTATVEGDTVTVVVTTVQSMYILPLPDRRIVATESATATDADIPVDQEAMP